MFFPTGSTNCVYTWGCEAKETRADKGKEGRSVDSGRVSKGDGGNPMTRNLSERFAELKVDARTSDTYWVEEAILDFTEEIARLLNEGNLTRKELAERLGTSKAYVTKILRGSANFTIESMVKIGRALGCKMQIELVPAEVQQAEDLHYVFLANIKEFYEGRMIACDVLAVERDLFESFSEDPDASAFVSEEMDREIPYAA